MPVRTTSEIVEPTAGDLDRIIDELKASWKATISIRRTAKIDIGHREIFFKLDDEDIGLLRFGEELTRDVAPGKHRLKADNTLFRKTVDFDVAVGEHATFVAINRAGFGTYSVFAFFVGGGPIYLTFEREGGPAGGTR
jgi:hypothetical protein